MKQLSIEELVKYAEKKISNLNLVIEQSAFTGIKERLIEERQLAQIALDSLRGREAQGVPFSYYANGAYYDTERATLKDSAEEITPLFTASQLPVVPEGWQLVPKEPTTKMLIAGDGSFGTRHVYRDMLSAAPKPGGE